MNHSLPPHPAPLVFFSKCESSSSSPPSQLSPPHLGKLSKNNWESYFSTFLFSFRYFPPPRRRCPAFEKQKGPRGRRERKEEESFWGRSSERTPFASLPPPTPPPTPPTPVFPEQEGKEERRGARACVSLSWSKSKRRGDMEYGRSRGALGSKQPRNERERREKDQRGKIEGTRRRRRRRGRKEQVSISSS